MRRLCVVFVGIMAASQQSSVASDQIARVLLEPRQSPYMRVWGQALPPIGYVQFCERNPFDCESTGRTQNRLELTTDRMGELDLVNRTVNKEIEPATDRDIFGVEEYWAYPDARGKGDCEDYVLLKRKRLMTLGWPESALLVTVVMDERNEGHAVLTVRTMQGDFIVDNKNDDIKPWYRTPYKYVMRQSFLHPRIWVSLEQKEPNAVAVSGVKRSR
ncbi:MAG: transglutaminase-like cysteine peptidase [Hyphomicrobiaceae bacterium]|nr:MAG: transglutaminase-like cysteine peptidase [Hyphomicrobiaceae bacterium]